MAGPYTPFSNAEILAAVLGDAGDGLESLQVPNPSPGIEQILMSVRFVQRELIKHIPPEVDHGQKVGK